MQHLDTFRRIGVAACLAAASLAQAATLDINLAGWKSWSEWYGPSATDNSEVFADIGAGSTVTGFEYIGLAFSTENGSWLRELTLSVSDNDDLELFMDWRPSTVGAEGSFGPASGSWGGPSGSAGLIFGPGASFTSASGMLWVTVYETFDDPFEEDEPWLFTDATITAGTLRIHYDVTPVPEPETYGMMALGLGVLGVIARRRRQTQD